MIRQRPGSPETRPDVSDIVLDDKTRGEIVLALNRGVRTISQKVEQLVIDSFFKILLTPPFQAAFDCSALRQQATRIDPLA